MDFADRRNIHRLAVDLTYQLGPQHQVDNVADFQHPDRRP